MDQSLVGEALRNFILKYREAPVPFVREVLGAEPDPWQAEFLEAIAGGNRRISVRSGHGVGKSTAAAWAAIWYILTRYTCRIVITAPTSGQLFDALFAEIKIWVKSAPPSVQALLDVKSDVITYRPAPDANYIAAKTSRAEQPEALQGVHADYVLLIADEASGVPDAVFEAASGSMSAAHACMILLGNPVRSSGLFHRSHHDLREQWYTMHVSCVGSPRVSPEYVEEKKAEYGEDTNAYRVRVLGEFPRADDDTIIPIELIEGAIRRDVIQSEVIKPVWGLDVARFGSDSTVLMDRRGRKLHGFEEWKGLDTMQVAGVVQAKYNDLSPVARPEEILVDSIGYGAGVADRLREFGLPARDINVSEIPSVGGRYANLRTELWFNARDWLAMRDCSLPAGCNKLEADLAGLRYKFSASGKLQAESKDDLKKRRKGRSPDFGDAFVLTFAGRAATALTGWGANSKWTKPLRRNVQATV